MRKVEEVIPVGMQVLVAAELKTLPYLILGGTVLAAVAAVRDPTLTDKVTMIAVGFVVFVLLSCVVFLLRYLGWWPLRRHLKARVVLDGQRIKVVLAMLGSGLPTLFRAPYSACHWKIAKETDGPIELVVPIRVLGFKIHSVKLICGLTRESRNEWIAAFSEREGAHGTTPG